MSERLLVFAHTADIVVDLSGVVQQSELLAAHYLPGLCISQFVSGWKNTNAPMTASDILALEAFFWSLLAETGTELT